MARPLDDQLDSWRGEVGIGIDRHLAEGPRARNDDQKSEHQHEKALAKGELNDAMNHERVAVALLLMLNRILELEK
jgi:hypothetical protein